MNILFIKGIPDDGWVKMIKHVQGKPIFDTGGSANVFGNIESDEFTKHLLILDSSMTSELQIPKSIDIIFNQISEADTYMISLKKVQRIIDHLNIKIINHPDDIRSTTRDQIYSKLKDIESLTVPKTIRIRSEDPKDIILKAKENSLLFPLLLREVGSHGGDNTFLVKKEADLKTLYAAPLDGREYYLTQFYDFKNQSNLFIKYRLVVINSEVYIRHAIISDHWKIHSKSRTDQYNNLEIEILNSFETKIKPMISNTIYRICKDINLDYFGIDCTIDENFNILIFELNANMNILLKSGNHTDKYLDIIKKATIEMIKKRISNV